MTGLKYMYALIAELAFLWCNYTMSFPLLCINNVLYCCMSESVSLSSESVVAHEHATERSYRSILAGF